MTKAELNDICRELENSYCNPIWRRRITDLTREVARLQGLVGSLDESSRPLATPSPSNPCAETVLF